MVRAAFFVSLVGLAALLFAQEPSAQNANPTKGDHPVIKPVPESATLTSTICACPIYPVYQDGNDVLYYTEVCTPATSCTVNDVAYCWASDLNWPYACVPTGTNGNCDACDGIDFTQKDVGSAFGGMLAKKNKADTLQDHLLPTDVHFPDGQAHPRQGVKNVYTNDFYVKFKDKNNIVIYAKLFVARVRADENIGAPNPEQSDRLLFLGYQVGDLESTEKANAISVQSVVARRRTANGLETQSERVRTVLVSGSKFLVLLAKP